MLARIPHARAPMGRLLRAVAVFGLVWLSGSVALAQDHLGRMEPSHASIVPAPLARLGRSVAKLAASARRFVTVRFAARRSEVASRLALRRAPGRFRDLVPRLERDVAPGTAADPGLIMFLFESSASMASTIGGGDGLYKIEAAATAGDRVVRELIRDNRSPDGRLHDRVHVSQIMYGRSVHDGLGEAFVPLSRLHDRAAASKGAASRSFLRRTATKGREGPMREAFARAVGIVGQRRGARGARADRRPGLVVAFNVTDDLPSTGDPRDAVQALAQAVRESGDRLLLTNILASSDPFDARPATPISFPTEEQAAELGEDGRLLFEMSSPVPDELMPLARAANPAIATGTRPRMMVHGATTASIEQIMRAASSLVAGGGR